MRARIVEVLQKGKEASKRTSVGCSVQFLAPLGMTCATRLATSKELTHLTV